MANTIKLKRASGSDPGNSDLATGELAIRTSNCKLFSKNDSGSAIGIVAGSADTLTTARTIAGVSFDGSGNISLNNNAITNGAGYIADIVSDTSPQLGGNLDVNGNDIISASNGDIDLRPNGTGAVVFKGVSGNGGNGAGRFKLNCENNSHGITIQGPPHSAAANYTLTLPNDDGGSNEFLKSNGSGVLSWASALSDLVDDTSPQLGGDLDSNGHDIKITDGEKLKLGDGEDGELYHDGNHTYLKDVGTGNLRLAADDTIVIQKNTGGETIANFIPDGAVELYYNNSKAFETNGYGVKVTGGANGNYDSHNGGTVTFDFSSAAYHFVNMNANSTFAAPINALVGHSGTIFLTQDGTGSRTGSFNSAFKFVGGTAPTLSTAANAVDRLDFVCKASDEIHIAVSLDVK